MIIKKASNLVQRLISAVLLLPIVIFILWYGGWLYNLTALFVGILMLYEWYYIFMNNKQAFNKHKYLWIMLSIIYTFGTIYSLIAVYHRNITLLIFTLCIVWSTDIGAYCFGKMIGGAKIAIKISPNKTWSGLVGGIICATIAGFFVYPQYWYITPILALISQAGDFFESWVKRVFNVKDSGNIIPGHGGILDRIDGLVPVIIIVNLI